MGPCRRMGISFDAIRCWSLVAGCWWYIPTTTCDVSDLSSCLHSTLYLCVHRMQFDMHLARKTAICALTNLIEWLTSRSNGLLPKQLYHTRPIVIISDMLNRERHTHTHRKLAKSAKIHPKQPMQIAPTKANPNCQCKPKRSNCVGLQIWVKHLKAANRIHTNTQSKHTFSKPMGTSFNWSRRKTAN